MTAFELWKTAHILGAAILFGTGFGITYFCWFGYRSAMRAGDIGALRSVLRLTLIADAFVTVPAVALQAASGAILIERLGWPQSSPWSIAAWQLFALAGAFWLPAVCIQAYLSRSARRVPSTDWLPRSFHVWFRSWLALEIPVLVVVIAIVWLMVAKPLLTK